MGHFINIIIPSSPKFFIFVPTFHARLLLVRLHCMHNVCRLLSSSMPPWLTGMIWSISKRYLICCSTFKTTVTISYKSFMPKSSIDRVSFNSIFRFKCLNKVAVFYLGSVGKNSKKRLRDILSIKKKKIRFKLLN